MVLLLLLIIAVILLCDHIGGPISLLRDTEFAHLDQERTYRAVVTEYPTRATKTNRLDLRLLAIEQNGTFPLQGHILLYQDTAATLPTLGDTLLLRTRVRRGGLWQGFDYGRYLRRKGIIGTGYASPTNIRIIRPAKHIPLRLLPQYIQHRLYERIQSMPFASREAATLAALLLGYKEDLKPETKHAFQASGSAHILAVSGLHTGIIYAILWNLLTLFGLRKPLYHEQGKRIVISLIIILCLWAYALVTGFTPSVVRAVIMATILQVGYMCYRQALSLNSVAAAAVFILLFSPRSLFSVSFQLSFAAVIAIIAGVRIVRSRHWLTDLALVSIAAWLGTLPLTLYYFGQFSNYFLLTNFLLIPLAWLALCGGIACLILGTVPILGTALTFATQWVTWAINTTTHWIESLPGAVTMLNITLPMAAGLYAIIITMFSGIYLITKR